VTSVSKTIDPPAGSQPRASQRPATRRPGARPGGTAFAPVEAFLGGYDPTAAGATLAERLTAGRSDPINLLSLVLAIAVATVTVLRGPGDPGPPLVATVAFVAIEAMLATISGRRTFAWVSATRFALALGYIVLADLLVDPSGTWPFNALMIPVVALAAAQSRAAGWLTVGAVVLAFVPGFLMGEHSTDLSRRLIAWTFAAGLTAVGTRRVVSSLERSRDHLRRTQKVQRRQSRQLVAVERVGEILAREGPSPVALDSVVGLLVETFGYQYPSIYTWDGTELRLGAQRNYATPIESFPTDKGVIGRVARTRAAVFLPDVRDDPDYISAEGGVMGEISVPLLGQGDLLGVLNVEMPGPRRLDRNDFATLKIVADRLAVALALGRERQKLTERARLMDSLVTFSRTLGGSLDPAAVSVQVVSGASQVIAADMVLLTLHDGATGDFRVNQVRGGDPGVLGIAIRSGEGVTGRAIAAGRVLVEDRQARSDRPRAAMAARLADELAAMAAPLRAEQDVLGALSWFREDLAQPFTDQEQEVASLLAAQVALAIANAELHHATEVQAVTDALTGLANRRHFDASMARAEAGRQRLPVADRRAVAAVIFDLDHFGQVNKLHGHRLGDRVLEGFGEVIRARVRAADLAARYGGEEFVVILEGATLGEATRLADEIRTAFEDLRFDLPDGNQLAATVSAGCASLAPEEVAMAALIERADVGLAMAKSSGRNRVVAA
jgi:diguanylate cyclase (GGDEF)-like protein